MSKTLADYAGQKSTSISTARSLGEFLGDQMVKGQRPRAQVHHLCEADGCADRRGLFERQEFAGGRYGCGNGMEMRDGGETR